MIIRLITLSVITLALIGCGGTAPKNTKKSIVKKENLKDYGVTLSKAEQLNALTNYFIKEDLGIQKPQFPKKPIKPTLLKPLELLKSEFEKSDEFQARVNQEKRKRANEIKKIENNYKQEVQKYNEVVKSMTNNYNNEIKAKELAIDKSRQTALIKAYNTVYGKPYIDKNLEYDADTEKFYTVIKSTHGGFKESVTIHVPTSEAKSFQDNITSMETKIIFDYTQEKLVMKKILIAGQGKNYNALPTSKSYKSSVISVNLDSGSMHLSDSKLLSTSLALNSGNYGDISYADELQESANDIPTYLAKTQSVKIDKKRWLFIIGIEKYEYTDSVIYSATSAKEFKDVMKKRFGIAENNIRTLIDKEATSAKIDYKLRDMLKRVKKGDTIYFYYSGHGIPVPAQNNEPFMLAQDMNPAYMQDDRFKLKNIYKALYKSDATKVLVFVDSCFSGGTDNQALIKGVAATRIKPKKVDINQEKMLIMSAGSGIQYSNKYDKKSNRLFSYYLMRGLINNNSDTQRLYDYVKSNVQEKSYEMGSSYEQVPAYQGNIGLSL